MAYVFTTYYLNCKKCIFLEFGINFVFDFEFECKALSESFKYSDLENA